MNTHAPFNAKCKGNIEHNASALGGLTIGFHWMTMAVYELNRY